MENPNAICNYFIEKSFNEGIGISPLKLIKLVYISHGWYLALTDKPLISECIIAWAYGPMISSIYNNFKYSGNAIITSLIYNKLNNGNIYYYQLNDSSIIPFLNKIWLEYKKFDDITISSLCNRDGTPFSLTRKNNIIPNDFIKYYYKKLRIENEKHISTIGKD